MQIILLIQFYQGQHPMLNQKLVNYLILTILRKGGDVRVETYGAIVT